jgi:hypothetical protein
VANLQPAMQELGRLRQPLERVGALTEPMNRLVAVAGILDHPVLLVLAALGALAAWGLVTFVAVRLAIVSASRRPRVASRATV